MPKALKIRPIYQQHQQHICCENHFSQLFLRAAERKYLIPGGCLESRRDDYYSKQLKNNPPAVLSFITSNQSSGRLESSSTCRVCREVFLLLVTRVRKAGSTYLPLSFDPKICLTDLNWLKLKLKCTLDLHYRKRTP